MKQNFAQYVVDHLKQYLPYEFEDAILKITHVRKSNGRNLTGISIRNDLERGTSTLYVDEYERRYNSGEDLKKIMEEMADVIVFNKNLNFHKFKPSEIDAVLEYEKIKSNLALRLCDLEKSREFLEDKPYTPFGNLAITYRIQMYNGKGILSTAIIDNELLKNWNISTKQLHKDALKAESDRSGVRLYKMSLDFRLLKDRVDFYNSPAPLEKFPYILTNKQETNGACAVVQTGVLNRLSDLLKEDFYILPSSIHEVIIIPKSFRFKTLAEVDQVLQRGSRVIVPINDRLSDHSMFYDRKRKKLRYSRY